MRKCEHCGQEYRFVHQCYEMQPQKVKDKEEKPFKEALEQGRRTVIINNTATNPQWMAKIADKYGFAIKQVNQTGTMPFFSSVPIYMIIAEKVMTTEKETKFINCSYCQTRYDSNEYFKCPQCGSPTS